jgi:hypothetical protein
MKEITVEQLASQPVDWLQAAQQDRLVITKDGKPAAVMVGIENQDEEGFGNVERRTGPFPGPMSRNNSV